MISLKGKKIKKNTIDDLSKPNNPPNV